MEVVGDAFNDFNTSDFELIQLGWKPQFSYIISAPATTGVGDTANITVNVFDANYAPATAYTGTIHFTSTDGASTLPANYAFTLADGGAHTFSVTLRTAGRQSISANEVADPTVTGLRTLSVTPAIPTGLVATATTTTSIGLSWAAAAGASSYEIVRVPGFASPATTVSTAYIDNTATPGHSYVYRVRGLAAPSLAGSLSAPDVATTMFFTDDPLITNTTLVKSIHVDQLRQAVNAMRAAAGLAPQSFTDPTLSSSIAVKTVHVQQLRDALAQARATLGLATQPFTDATLTSSTLVKAVHLQDLRTGVK